MSIPTPHISAKKGDFAKTRSEERRGGKEG